MALIAAGAAGTGAVGFGFIDNFIMIIAGSSLDASLGLAFGISTMAAAGLGNLLSDVAGVGLEGVLARTFTVKAGPVPGVMRNTSWFRSAQVGGRMIGISIGCLLGMIPLLFMDTFDSALGTADKAVHGVLHDRLGQYVHVLEADAAEFGVQDVALVIMPDAWALPGDGAARVVAPAKRAAPRAVLASAEVSAGVHAHLPGAGDAPWAMEAMEAKQPAPGVHVHPIFCSTPGQAEKTLVASLITKAAPVQDPIQAVLYRAHAHAAVAKLYGLLKEHSGSREELVQQVAAASYDLRSALQAATAARESAEPAASER